MKINGYFCKEKLKEVADGLQSFGEGVTSVADGLKEIIKAFDWNVSCEAIYSTLASGSGE